MELQLKIDKIKNYRESGANWYGLASAIRDVSRSEAWRSQFASNADWLKEAAKVSGYHPGVIRRMIRAIYFLDKMVEQEGIIVDTNSDIPLSSLEILERMQPLAPEKVRELIDSVLNGTATLREVQREYDDIISQQSEYIAERRFPQLSRIFQQRAHKAVYASIEIFSGEGNIIIEHFNRVFPFPLRRDLIIAAKKREYRILECDGIITHFSATFEGMPVEKNIIITISYLSNYFRRFWIILPEAIGAGFVEAVTKRLRELGLYNVAFAVLKDHPESQAPEDLWHMIRSVCCSDSCSPNAPEFFPLERKYIPRWTDILLRYIN